MGDELRIVCVACDGRGERWYRVYELIRSRRRNGDEYLRKVWSTHRAPCDACQGEGGAHG